jgi:hypothetical protein
MDTSISPDELRAALTFAEDSIAQRCRGQILIDIATDKTTEAILEAALAYDRTAGPFGPFVALYITKAITWAIAKHVANKDREKRRGEALVRARGHDMTGVLTDTLADTHFAADVAELPDELARFVTLFCWHDYSITDAGFLCGWNPASAWKAMFKAFDLLNEIEAGGKNRAATSHKRG